MKTVKLRRTRKNWQKMMPAERREQKQIESMKNELANVYNTSSENSNRESDSGSHNTKKVRKLLLADNKSHIEWDGNKYVYPNVWI